VQCSAVQCSAVQCSTVQCSAVSAVQCSAVQSSAVQYSAVQCSTVQYSAVQYSAVQCSAVQYSAVQCSAVQHRPRFTSQRREQRTQVRHRDRKYTGSTLSPPDLVTAHFTWAMCNSGLANNHSVWRRHINTGRLIFVSGLG
jgi:hypothetical protein